MNVSRWATPHIFIVISKKHSIGDSEHQGKVISSAIDGVRGCTDIIWAAHYQSVTDCHEIEIITIKTSFLIPSDSMSRYEECVAWIWQYQDRLSRVHIVDDSIFYLILT